MKTNFLGVAAILILLGQSHGIGTAHADCPPGVDVINWDVDTRGVTLVGHNSGTVDPFHQTTVTATDFLARPVAGLPVTLWIHYDCRSDAHVCAAQPDVAQVECVPDGVKLTLITDEHGQVTFRVVGDSHAPGTNYNGWNGLCAVFGTVCASGQAAVPLASIDLDGGGVDSSDIAAWMADWASGLTPLRSDYDFNGQIDPADLAILIEAWGAGMSAQGCESLPGGILCK
jgi:hypothetical protein